MTILTMQKTIYETYASQLEDYKNISINELADGYCDAADRYNEVKRAQYFSALALRFWNTISNLAANNKSLNLSLEDYLNWVQEAILMACDANNRVWRSKNISAQQCINQVISTRFKAAAYYRSNLGIHKANYNPIRLDKELDSESGTTSLDLLADDSCQENSYSDALNTVQRFVDDNKIIEAIVLDTIAFSDTDVFKHTSTTIKEVDEETGEEYKYTEKKTKLWEFKLVQTLNELDSDYINYFSDTYQISNEKFAKVFEEMKKATNQKKYKYIDSAIEATRNLRKLVNKA